MSGETLSYMVLLVLLVGGIVAYIAWQLVREAKEVWRALIALRDRIDGTKGWP